MRFSALIWVLLLGVGGAHAEDWLLEAERAARTAAVPGEAAPEKPKPDWIPYESPSRLFRADLPPEGWRAFEEEDALGTVVRILGPDSASGSTRATLSVRLMDRDSPAYAPVKQAVDVMRRDSPGRQASPLRTLRTAAGLARTFEVTQMRRLPQEEGPAFTEELHQYVAVIPRGESYYVVRLVTARENYLDFRDDFVRFLKSLRPVGPR